MLLIPQLHRMACFEVCTPPVHNAEATFNCEGNKKNGSLSAYWGEGAFFFLPFLFVSLRKGQNTGVFSFEDELHIEICSEWLCPLLFIQ